MDFNALFAEISAYLGAGGLATAIVALITLGCKFGKVIKDVRKEFKATHSDAINAFKQAIPKELYISIESLAKGEFEKIKNDLIKEFKETIIEPIKANTELTQAIAEALMANKAIPDSVKTKIADMLKVEEPETVEALKVEMLPIEEKKPQTTTTFALD